MGQRDVNAQDLVDTARALVEGDKGLLAMDESTPTCDRRFAVAGIAPGEEARRAYRDMLATTPGLGAWISGAILYDETIRQTVADGTPLVDVLARAGIIAGIKVDTGAKRLALHAAETVTEGLDGLRARLLAYDAMGARFAKWRGVFALGEDLPSAACIAVNAHALARTCALAAPGAAATIEPDLSEWDYGDYEGLVSTDIRAYRPGWNIFRDGCPHGETPARVSGRADRLIERLDVLAGDVALFSHGQFGAVLAARWIGVGVVHGENFPLGPASLSILSHSAHHPQVRTVELWNAGAQG